MARAMSLDFTKVKEGGGSFNKKRQPAGDYRALVAKVQDHETKEEKKPSWLYTIKVGAGTYPYYCTFDTNTLWKIRNLFVAAGINVPKKKVKVNPEMVVGKYIGVTLEDDEYDNKEQSTVAATFPVSELGPEAGGTDPDDDLETDTDDEDEDENDVVAPVDDDDEEEEEEATPPPAKKKKPAPAPVAEDDEDDELEELDIEDM